MNHEIFIEEIVDELLTSVDHDILTLMASNTGTTKKRGMVDLAVSMCGSQNLKGPEPLLFVMLSPEKRIELRDTFDNRYRRMIREFIDLKEKLLNHQYFPDTQFKDEIIAYIRSSDSALGNSIYKIAESQSVLQPTQPIFEYEEREFAPDWFTGPGGSAHSAGAAKTQNVSMTSNQCKQRFKDIKTSDKGMVQLTGSGNPFIFDACYIAEVIPCLKSEKQNDFAPIFDLVKIFSGEPLPQKNVYTAVKMKGKYEGVNFISVEFDVAFPKLKEAMRISNSIQNKRHGEFK